MPRIKSNQQQVRIAEKRQLRNRSMLSQCKTNITKAEKLIFAGGELDSARRAVVTAITSLDKAAEKGIIHHNTAARRKSRLMKKINDMLALSSVEAGAAVAESAESEDTE